MVRIPIRVAYTLALPRAIGAIVPFIANALLPASELAVLVVQPGVGAVIALGKRKESCFLTGLLAYVGYVDSGFHSAHVYTLRP